jgi:hypothetical protein
MHISQLPHKGQYVAVMRKIRALPADARCIDTFSGWHRIERPAGEIRAHARRALDRRINDRGGRREDSEPVPIDLQRDAWDLDGILTKRMRVYQFRTPMMRERFGHLLARHDD